jgi:hypothetical protein
MRPVIRADGGKEKKDILGNKIFPRVCANFNSIFSAVNTVGSGPSDIIEKDPLSDLTPQQNRLAASMLHDLQLGRSICLFGNKVEIPFNLSIIPHKSDCICKQGAGKSHIASYVARTLQAEYPQSQLQVRLLPEVFPLYQEMTARDMLQTRVTTSTRSDGPETASRSSWRDSPLIHAARTGAVCILDGIDRVDPHCLLALSRLLHDRSIDLPNGERLAIHPTFRLIALGLPPITVEDAHKRYIGIDLNLSFHRLPEMINDEIRSIIQREFGRPLTTISRDSDEKMFMAIAAVLKAAEGALLLLLLSVY